MRVVIAGAGSVGRSIARELLAHGHEVTLIDRQPSAMRVASVADAEWLLADACELPTLSEAKTGARIAYLQRYGQGLLPTPDGVLQENDVLRVLVRVEDTGSVERILTKAPEVS